MSKILKWKCFFFRGYTKTKKCDSLERKVCSEKGKTGSKTLKINSEFVCVIESNELTDRSIGRVMRKNT